MVKKESYNAAATPAKRETSPNIISMGITAITSTVEVEKDEDAAAVWNFHWKPRGGGFTEEGHKKVNRTTNTR